MLGTRLCLTQFKNKVYDSENDLLRQQSLELYVLLSQTHNSYNFGLFAHYLWNKLLVALKQSLKSHTKFLLNLFILQ